MDFCALAGTARGERVVPVPGRGAVSFGEATGTPAGSGVGRGMALALRAAIPGLGTGFRLIFSACRAAVAGAKTGTGFVTGRDFSRASESLSMAAVSWSIF